MIFFGRRHLAHLEAEIVWLREQMLHERRRAEEAINLVLAQKQAMPISVTPPPPADDVVTRLLSDREFVTAGGL